MNVELSDEEVYDAVMRHHEKLLAHEEFLRDFMQLKLDEQFGALLKQHGPDWLERDLRLSFTNYKKTMRTEAIVEEVSPPLSPWLAEVKRLRLAQRVVNVVWRAQDELRMTSHPQLLVSRLRQLVT